MNFYVMTLFPEMIDQGLNNSIMGRAIDKGLIQLDAVNIRDYSNDLRHKKVDDYTYGGGAGMLMQAQPIYDCYKAIEKKIEESHSDKKKPRVVYVTPQGRVFNQQMARDFAKEEDLVFLCGHYEGVDERVLEEIVTDYVSIGDYVLTGGELPAMVMIDCISRLVKGVLNNDVSSETESFNDGLLEYPQYSRPEEWMGRKVPPILLSGNHKKVDEWRLEKAIERTKERRPDMYEEWIKLHPVKPPKKRRRKHHADENGDKNGNN
ncbi:tRNA (guanosine(37)-N1)-methyltransferase TrmD [Butyrivibrio sp. NC3005]|uniref:tRNA (guanosine(37)-N1)-methyltransferase TrmD n=1 Tax=Butyrivibrio sp. NC3005 TaxID=1280685 RepID=UPI000420D387|nr:tRNA (guanosine(37)-N1)-methyltransferase TrmD [Butyrivibrio sp. NC3005]